jgi:hypothetical protein
LKVVEAGKMVQTKTRPTVLAYRAGSTLWKLAGKGPLLRTPVTAYTTFMRRRGDNAFARDLIELSLGEGGLREFGQYPLFLAVQRAYVDSQGSPQGRPEARALAEGALWSAITEWLAGRDYPTGSARDTIEAAQAEGFDLVGRVRELLLPRQFLR